MSGHIMYIQIFCSLESPRFVGLNCPKPSKTDFEFVQAEGPEPTSIVQTQDDRSSRFIGDLNPEGIFLAATSPDATRGVSNDSIGVW